MTEFPRFVTPAARYELTLPLVKPFTSLAGVGGSRLTDTPGTGKTAVAVMMADLLRRLGYLPKGHLVHAMRADLVGEYIGHTAPKTMAVLDRAMGGVQFIDEVYTLFRAEDSKDYGQECIDILTQVMGNERDKLVVILAGYKERMDKFFKSTPA